jgi:acylphosphatase
MRVFHVKQVGAGHAETFHVKHSRGHWRIYGAVQRVGFREYTRRAAHDAGLAGYVRNRPDGSVEVEAEGTPQALNRLRQALQAGPPFATVREVREETPGTSALPKPFAIRY